MLITNSIISQEYNPVTIMLDNVQTVKYVIIGRIPVLSGGASRFFCGEG